MSSPPPPTPLKDFTRLGASVYLYDPQRAPRNTSDPELILLLSWYEAQPRHINKYTSHYQTQYPTSRILLLTTNLPDLALPGSTHRTAKRRLPAVEILLALPRTPRVLLHAFSNGGSTTAVALMKDFLRASGHALPVRLQVLDSAPGGGALAESVRALSAGLPRGNRLLYLLGLGLLWGFLIAWACLSTVGGSQNPILALRRELNAEEVWGRVGRRLYLAGERDVMVGLGDVLAHAREAEEGGWVVRREVFAESGHVGHMLADPGRYWGAVRRAWEEK